MPVCYTSLLTACLQLPMTHFFSLCLLCAGTQIGTLNLFRAKFISFIDLHLCSLTLTAASQELTVQILWSATSSPHCRLKPPPAHTRCTKLICGFVRSFRNANYVLAACAHEPSATVLFLRKWCNWILLEIRDVPIKAEHLKKFPWLIIWKIDDQLLVNYYFFVSKMPVTENTKHGMFFLN